MKSLPDIKRQERGEQTECLRRLCARLQEDLIFELERKRALLYDIERVKKNLRTQG
jgi:uncharacterized protein YcgL (UPF0745 family)